MPQGKELASQVAGATAVDAGRYKGLVTPVGFTTPSGNLTCGLSAGADAMVTCQIESFTFTSPAGDCNGGGSGGAIVYTPPAQPVFACSGDVESGGPVLQYGSKLSVKGLTCVSRAVGVICVDDRAHGFLLARARYSVQ